MSDTVSLKDAAQRLGVSPSYAYRLARDGQFPVAVIKIGRLFRVPVRALDHLLATGSQFTPEGDPPPQSAPPGP